MVKVVIAGMDDDLMVALDEIEAVIAEMNDGLTAGRSLAAGLAAMDPIAAFDVGSGPVERPAYKQGLRLMDQERTRWRWWEQELALFRCWHGRPSQCNLKALGRSKRPRMRPGAWMARHSDAP